MHCCTGRALVNNVIFCYYISALFFLFLYLYGGIYTQLLLRSAFCFCSDSFSGHFGLSSCPQQRSALCAYSSLYIFICFLFFSIAVEKKKKKVQVDFSQAFLKITMLILLTCNSFFLHLASGCFKSSSRLPLPYSHFIG